MGCFLVGFQKMGLKGVLDAYIFVSLRTGLYGEGWN